MFRQSKGEDEILKHFICFVCGKEERWKNFWSRFRPDGTMTWKEFERYIHWDEHWRGETYEAFQLLEEDGCGYITNAKVLKLRRWWQNHEDLKDANTEAFRKNISKHWGNMGRAWRLAFDTNATGRCCQVHFCRVCHSLGMDHNLRGIWADLTEGDINRSLYYRDIDPEGDMVVQMFATAMTLHGGTLVEGWQQLIRDAGGHIHRDAFIEHCAPLGIGVAPAKWLFSVLDPNGTRYLTEFDDLDFLMNYDPGPLELEAGAAAFQRELSGKGTASSPFHVKGVEAFDAAEAEAFDLIVQLTREEYEAYQQKLRGRHMISGNIDAIKGGARAKEENKRTENPRPTGQIQRPRPGGQGMQGDLQVGWLRN